MKRTSLSGPYSFYFSWTARLPTNSGLFSSDPLCRNEVQKDWLFLSEQVRFFFYFLAHAFMEDEISGSVHCRLRSFPQGPCCIQIVRDTIQTFQVLIRLRFWFKGFFYDFIHPCLFEFASISHESKYEEVLQHLFFLFHFFPPYHGIVSINILPTIHFLPII